MDEAAATLVMQATESAQKLLPRKDPNFASSLAFLFAAVGVLFPFSETLGRTTYTFIQELLVNDVFAEYTTSHPQFGNVCVAIADFLAVLNENDLREVSPPVVLSFFFDV